MTRLRLVPPIFAALFLYAPPGFASDALWPRALPVGRWVHADSPLELSIERGSALVFRAGQSETRGEFYSYQQVRNEYWGCFSLTARSEASAPEKPGAATQQPGEKPAAPAANAPAGESARPADPATPAEKPAGDKPSEASTAAATGGAPAEKPAETKPTESGPNKSSAPANFNNRPGRDAPPAAPPGPPDLGWISPVACAILAFEGNETLTLYAFPDGEKPGPVLRFMRPGARRVEPAQGP